MRKTVLRGEDPPLPDPSSNSGIHVRPNRPSTTSTPRWVKVLVVIFIILVLLFVIMHFTGNGFGNHLRMSSIEPWVQQL